jgi:hypothetical protein
MTAYLPFGQVESFRDFLVRKVLSISEQQNGTGHGRKPIQDVCKLALRDVSVQVGAVIVYQGVEIMELPAFILTLVGLPL